jgi:threonine/homoserine/homoserine lactone efflux protein
MNPIIDPSVFIVFIPTFFFVSATPGMCMTLSMTLGMTIGLRRTFWMMWGELVGVALVSIAAVAGVAAVMLSYPAVFLVLKYAGGGYLGYLGIQMWRSKGKMALGERNEERSDCSGLELAGQGFVTAIANPKGWAFMISLLPPFISPSYSLAPQMAILLVIILSIEFCCLIVYASGGKTLRNILRKRSNIRAMNRISGTLMLGVGVWLAAG